MSRSVQLSRAQKWDLIRIAGAGLLSAALFGVTLVRSLQHQPTALSAEVAPTVVAPAPEPRVQVTARDVAVPVAAPKLSPVRVRLARGTPRAASRPAMVRVRNTPSIGGRFVRLFAGSGRYTVRPFPTIGN
ncbi:MAG: hypothetical protein ABI818_17835 [Acidobacteriota bacterium]